MKYMNRIMYIWLF